MTDLADHLEKLAQAADCAQPDTVAVFGEAVLNNLPAILSALRLQAGDREAVSMIERLLPHCEDAPLYEKTVAFLTRTK